MNVPQPSPVEPLPDTRLAALAPAIDRPHQNLIAAKGSTTGQVTTVTLPQATTAQSLSSTPQTRGTSTPIPAGATVLSVPSPWAASAGTTSRQTLTAWVTRAGWTLIWDARSAGPSLPKAIEVRGDFLDALRALMRAGQIPGAPYPLRVEAFPRQKIVHVADKD